MIEGHLFATGFFRPFFSLDVCVWGGLGGGRGVVVFHKASQFSLCFTSSPQTVKQRVLFHILYFKLKDNFDKNHFFYVFFIRSGGFLSQEHGKSFCRRIM